MSDLEWLARSIITSLDSIDDWEERVKFLLGCLGEEKQ